MYYATKAEITLLDDLAVRHGLEVRQMMELAGWHMLRVLSELKISNNDKIMIFVGKGNKGGDGLTCARHLINNGFQVDIILMNKDISSDSAHQLKILNKMIAQINYYEQIVDQLDGRINSCDVIIDALVGYKLSGSPRGSYGDVVSMMSQYKKKIISYDVPTGIDSTTGECFEPYVRAHATLTLALPKKCFEVKNARNASGRLFLGDIGIPSVLYDEIFKNCRPDFKGSGGVIKI